MSNLGLIDIPEDPAFSTGGRLIFKCIYLCVLENMFWFMLQNDPIQSYLNLKIGLPPVLKAGSSGSSEFEVNTVFLGPSAGPDSKLLLIKTD